MNYIGAPLPPGSFRETLIDCVLDIAEIEPPGDHLTSHWIFCRKVLREPPQDAFAIAARYRSVKLTRDSCELLVRDWDRDVA